MEDGLLNVTDILFNDYWQAKEVKRIGKFFENWKRKPDDKENFYYRIKPYHEVLVK